MLLQAIPWALPGMYLVSITPMETISSRITMFLRINCADFFSKVPGGMDVIPTPISVVRHKPTWRRDLADFWN
ncbi:hypothetical protein E2C01_033188 [Portunus trituberculatus]|uniref:Uncharacterized protein n=1 Tax=Portunus trituberculatus TaxID=210409 RepID=A0A5B7F3J8_PORTR|nr:hypothetical protein [Portunus trituberculatus]